MAPSFHASIAQRRMRYRALLVVALAAILALPSHAAERSKSAVAEFKRSNPCPATGKSRGACPGWQVDHIEPLCAGGRDDPSNMAWITVSDHKAKTRKDVAACFGRVYRPQVPPSVADTTNKP